MSVQRKAIAARDAPTTRAASSAGVSKATNFAPTSAAVKPWVRRDSPLWLDGHYLKNTTVPDAMLSA